MYSAPDKEPPAIMSSMTRLPILALRSFPAPRSPRRPFAQDAAMGPRRAELVASSPARWRGHRPVAISGDDGRQLPFTEYAGFLLAYPGFPGGDRLRDRAEQRLPTNAAPAELVRFFENAIRRSPILPRRNMRWRCAPDRAERPNARDAWRGGEMSATARGYLLSMFGSSSRRPITTRGWTRCCGSATRSRAAPDRPRLARQARSVPGAARAPPGRRRSHPDAGAMSDPGYVYNRSRELRREGRLGEAVRCSPTARLRPPASTRRLGRPSCSPWRAPAARPISAHIAAMSTSCSRRAPISPPATTPARRLHLADVARRHERLWDLGDGAARRRCSIATARPRGPRRPAPRASTGRAASARAGKTAEATALLRDGRRTIPTVSMACSRSTGWAAKCPASISRPDGTATAAERAAFSTRRSPRRCAKSRATRRGAPASGSTARSPTRRRPGRTRAGRRAGARYRPARSGGEPCRSRRGRRASRVSPASAIPTLAPRRAPTGRWSTRSPGRKASSPRTRSAMPARAG